VKIERSGRGVSRKIRSYVANMNTHEIISCKDCARLGRLERRAAVCEPDQLRLNGNAAYLVLAGKNWPALRYSM
jgi:hypothetical protein